MNKWSQTLRRSYSTVPNATGHYGFLEAMRPVSRVRVLNPTATIPNPQPEEARSYFYNEPIVTEKTALEEVLFRRYLDLNPVVRTPEQQAERRIINRLENQRLKKNTETIWDRIQTIHEDMRITGLKPTVRIYSKTISALVAGHRVDKAHEMFAKMRTIFPDDQIPGALVAYLIYACKFSKDTLRAQGYMKILQQLYENRPSNEESEHILAMAFTNLINIYSSNSDIDGVEQTFTQMRGANLKPDEHAFANVMKIYSKRRDYEKAESLIETMDTVGKEEGRLKKQFSTMLMQAYPAEMLAKSEEIFQGLEKPDWMAYEMMMKKYIEAKQYQKVYDLYEQLKTNRVKIEQRIYATILDACYYDGLVIKPDLVETIKKQLYQDAYQTPKNSFDMHRIKRYWREMREIYSYRKREPLVKRALTRILKTRKQHASDTNKQAYEARELGVRKEKARKEFEDRAREVEIEREQAKLQQQLAIQQAREKKKQRQ